MKLIKINLWILKMPDKFFNKKDNKIIEQSISNYNFFLNDPFIKKYIQIMSSTFRECKLNKRKIFIAGNGGSSSIASHVSVDLTKVVGIKSFNFNEHNLITCLTNDYGQDNWLQKAFEFYSTKSDLIVLISSSGKSKNIVKAAKFCKKRGNKVIGLSGFNKNNPLSKYGKVNFYIGSTQYNFIEMSHHIILVYLVDIFAKNKLKI